MIINNTNSIIYETCIDESLTFFNEKFSFNPIEMIRKAFKWIIDKIDRAIKFIKDKLKRKPKKTNNTKPSNTEPKKPYNDDKQTSSNSDDFESTDTPKNNTKNRVKVSSDFVKKCTIYLNASYISNNFFKKLNTDINKIKSGMYKNIDNIIYHTISNIDVLGEDLVYISHNEWYFNIGAFSNNSRIVFTSKEKELSYAYKNNVDILKITTDFRKQVKQYESKMIDIVKNLEDKDKISDINEFMKEFKRSCTYFIAKLTKVADFDIESELNKLIK